MDRTLVEYTPESEAFDSEGFECRETGDLGGSREVFGEVDETKLAADMLGVASEQELDRFLGDLIRRAGQAAGTFISSPVRQALGGILKGAARYALPMAGPAIGRHAGGERDAQATSAAGRLFGLELEGLSPEDQEFELAKNYIRFAGDAVKKAAAASSSAPPQAVAHSAAVQAAQAHAPGLLG